MSLPRISLIVLAFAILPAIAPTHSDASSTDAKIVKQRKPHFPISERTRGREGWVLISYSIDSDGSVVDPVVEDSSRSDAFEKSALIAIQKWRYEPGAEQEQKTLLTFVFRQRFIRVSRKFVSRNQQIHEFIDSGAIEAAQEAITEIRNNKYMTVFELAYTYLAEARIAGKRGDRAGQLRHFRQAMLNKGRWLPRDNYLKCLRAVVIMEIQLNDFASAIRDYELLTETGIGRDIAADLDETIEAIKEQVQSNGDAGAAYRVANSVVSTKRDLRITSSDRMQGPSDADNRPTAPPTQKK